MFRAAKIVARSKKFVVCIYIIHMLFLSISYKHCLVLFWFQLISLCSINRALERMWRVSRISFLWPPSITYHVAGAELAIFRVLFLEWISFTSEQVSGVMKIVKHAIVESILYTGLESRVYLRLIFNASSHESDLNTIPLLSSFYCRAENESRVWMNVRNVSGTETV